MPKRGEAIYHRQDGLWEARYVKGVNLQGKKEYGSVYGHSYEEAKEKRADIVRSGVLPAQPAAHGPLLNELILEWLYLNEGRIKASTYQKYHTFYEKHIRDGLGKQAVISLTPVKMKQFADEKKSSGLSATTVNSILTFIRTCLKYGNRQYGMPIVDIIYLKTPHKEMRVLSVEEQNRLVTHLLQDTDIYKLGILLALFTGLRIGELCALTWGDIRSGQLKVTKTMQRLRGENSSRLVVDEPKSASSNRTVPIPSFLVPLVEAKRRPDREYFLSTENLSVVEPRVMQNHFKSCIKQVSIEKATFHTLRHSFATRCVEAGVDIKSLSEILGHSNCNITLNRYVHSSFSLKAKNIEKLVRYCVKSGSTIV